jgi:two-component sensor histidine kinase
VKRTPWLSWRLYFLTIPVDLIVLLLSSDHASTGSNDFFNWAILSFIAHGSVAPVFAMALFFTKKVNSWKVDLFALIMLGAFRGVAIDVGVEILDLDPKVSSLYKVFNSSISLPLWFIGIVVFVESRRQYQREFQAIFLRYIRDEQTAKGSQNLSFNGNLAGESIRNIQSATSELASEIEKVLDLPTTQVNYSKQKSKIQDLISRELRPASTKLWNGFTLSAPELSTSALIRISLLEQKLKVISAALFFSPYILIGLNGSQGWKFAFVAALLATFLNTLIFLICETFFKLGVFDRKTTNIAILGLSFILPLITILFILPANLFWTDSIATAVFYQLFLYSCHFLFLLGFNLYRLLGRQRSIVLADFERIIQGKELSLFSNYDLAAAGDVDLARYLHGELQAGLIASSLLLERASKTGDTDLARHALRNAVDILSQDHAQTSLSRVSSPQVRLERISSGWRGIANVSINMDWLDGLETSTQNNVVVLIDEGVSNAIRHAKASEISVSGSRLGADLLIEIQSDGSGMKENAPGLGTKLFTELATNWEYSRREEKNILKFTIRAND